MKGLNREVPVGGYGQMTGSRKKEIFVIQGKKTTSSLEKDRMSR